MNDEMVNMSELTPTEKQEVIERDIVEDYFRAVGWVIENELNDDPALDRMNHLLFQWIAPDGVRRKKLPNITQHYPDFKLWVLEDMEAEGFHPHLTLDDTIVSDGMGGETDGPAILLWVWGHETKPTAQIEQEVEDNEILCAAVVAATRYFEQKNTDQKGATNEQD